MLIRRASEADIAAIVAMQAVIHREHLAWDAARWSTRTSPAEVYPAWLAELTRAASDGLVLVATAKDQAIGYAVADVEAESPRHWIPQAVYLHDLYVDPTHRGQGVARAMMDELLRWAAATHPTLQVRLTTAAQNDAARRFFARYGFRACAVEMLREPSLPPANSPTKKPTHDRGPAL